MFKSKKVFELKGGGGAKSLPLTPRPGPPCPWTPLGALPQIPVIGPRSALAVGCAPLPNTFRGLCPCYKGSLKEVLSKINNFVGYPDFMDVR